MIRDLPARSDAEFAIIIASAPSCLIDHLLGKGRIGSMLKHKKNPFARLMFLAFSAPYKLVLFFHPKKPLPPSS